MLQTYEAVLQPNGSLQFLDLPAMPTRTPRRVLVTFTDEPIAVDTAICGAVLSEAALAQDPVPFAGICQHQGGAQFAGREV